MFSHIFILMIAAPNIKMLESEIFEKNFVNFMMEQFGKQLKNQL